MSEHILIYDVSYVPRYQGCIRYVPRYQGCLLTQSTLVIVFYHLMLTMLLGLEPSCRKESGPDLAVITDINRFLQRHQEMKGVICSCIPLEYCCHPDVTQWIDVLAANCTVHSIIYSQSNGSGWPGWNSNSEEKAFMNKPLSAKHF